MEKGSLHKPNAPRITDIHGRRLAFMTASLLSVLLSTKALIHEALAETSRGVRSYQSIGSDASVTIASKITSISHGLRSFAASVLANLDRHVSDPIIKDIIRRAFEIGLRNTAQNPAAQLARATEVQFGMENGFRYDFHDRRDIITFFNGLTRTLTLPRDFDPNDIGDMTFLLHELMHVDEDDLVRKTVPWQTYTTYWRSAGEKPLCIIESETAIIGAELEALNAALKGSIKSKTPKIPARRPEVKRTLTNGAIHYRAGSLKAAVEKSCRKYAVVFGPDLTRHVFEQ